eukprot:361404-Amphidinium_carterae.4
MVNAVQKKKALTIPPSRLRPAAVAATADEVTAFRGLLGSMMWCARCACPQGLAAYSILAARTSTLKVQGVRDLNAELLRLQKTVTKMHIIGADPGDSGYTLFSDASFANREDQRRQIGSVVGKHSIRQMKENGVSQFSILDFTSHKFRRVASSAETAALVEGLSNLEWLIAWRKWIEEEARPTSTPSHLGAIELQTIEKRGDDLQQQVLAAVDSKSLQDVVRGTNIDGVERRAALESLLARDLLKSLSAMIRWIPHEQNPSDSMTKISANHECLLTVLRTSSIRLRPEKEILEERKEYRLETGKQNPRPKKSS